jgi:hypothetical protein
VAFLCTSTFRCIILPINYLYFLEKIMSPLQRTDIQLVNYFLDCAHMQELHGPTSKSEIRFVMHACNSCLRPYSVTRV